MRAYHGVDAEIAVKAWMQHKIRASMRAKEINYIDGCENPFHPLAGVVSITPFASTARRYAAVAIIEIDVDDEYVYQTSSDEYQMLISAPYKVLSVNYTAGAGYTMTRLSSGKH
jgi:hypothetical protein